MAHIPTPPRAGVTQYVAATGFLVFKDGPRPRSVVAPLVILVAILLGGQAAAFLLGGATMRDAIAGAAQALVVLALALLDTLPYARGWRSNALYWRHMAERLAGELRTAQGLADGHYRAASNAEPIVDAAVAYVRQVMHDYRPGDGPMAYGAWDSLYDAVAEYDPDAVEVPDEDEQDDLEPVDATYNC